MKHIHNVPWELGDIVPDFVLGKTTCALFLRWVINIMAATSFPAFPASYASVCEVEEREGLGSIIVWMMSLIVQMMSGGHKWTVARKDPTVNINALLNLRVSFVLVVVST